MSHERVLSVTGKKHVPIFVIWLRCRKAQGDVWRMHWMRSTTESNSHFHCAPAMGQLQHILGHTFCWGFSFFLPSCGPGLGEPGSGQQPRCSGEGPHNLNLYSSVSAQGGDAAGSATLHPRCWMRAHSLHAREGPAWALPAELRCLPLGGSAGTRAERGVWCSSMLSLV